MKSSIVSTMLWVVNIGLLAGGFYFAYDLFSTTHKQNDTVQANVKAHKSNEVETWDDAKVGSESFSIPSVPLQVGSPHAIPKKPPVIDPPPPIPVEVIPSPEELTKEIQSDMAKRFSIERVILIYPRSGLTLKLSNPSFTLGSTVYVGDNIEKVLKKYAEDNPKDTAAKTIGGAGIDAVITDISRSTVTCRVSNESVKKYLSKWKEEERPKDGRLTVTLLVNVETALSLEDLRDGNFPTVSATGGPSTTKPVRPDPKVKVTDPNLIPFKDLPRQPSNEDAAVARDPEWQKTKTRDDGSIQFGWEDMTQENFDELASHVEGMVDGNGRSIGLRISDDLPDNKLARDAGARPGDIIKSINGQPVASVAEVKRVVTKLRNAGETAFKVVYERNGLEQTKTFHSQPKKK